MGVSRTASKGTGAGGFSLLELLIAVAIFGVAMAALSATQLASMRMSRANQDAAIASDAAVSVLEALRDEDDFQKIFARWNADAADDPAGTPAPGNAFDVRGLEPVRDDADGHVGEVVFPGDGTQLLENGNDRTLGMPRDLDLDGQVDGANHAANYGILPVLVRVRWTGAGGVQQVQIVGTLARR